MLDRTIEQIGNYRIARLIDRGGFAYVYLGEHIYLGTQVAIKVLATTLTVDERDNFLTEARTIAQLVHPNIVRVLDFGVHNGVPFLVMDYAPDGSLRRRYPKGTKLSLETTVAYVKQIASALEYAHAHKLIHRDIKPENILLGRDNQLFLSDFGIAVVARSSLSQSQQEIVGTITYMAPEQLEGKPRQASDQYALAILVYEWLCGEQPFRGSFTEIAAQQMLTAPPPLREKAPEIPTSVEQVIMRALAKDPKQRYSTISDFAQALEEASQLLQPTLEVPPHVVEKPGGGVFDEGRGAWRMSKRQVPSMIGGVLLYTILSNLVILIHLQPAGGNELLWILPALVIPFFFGVVYGPWVGLVTGGLGYFLGNYISLAVNWHANAVSGISFLSLASLSLPWYFYVAFSSIGLVAGLGWLLTKGRYNSLHRLTIAEIVSCVAILLAFLIAFNGFWPHLYTYETTWLDFTHIALPNMALVLILLPIMLIVHNLIRKAKVDRHKH